MPSSIPLKPWQKAKDAGYHVVEQTTATDLPSNDYKATTTITNWPTSPRSLHKSKTALFGEIALLIFPIAFMGLAATAWSFDQKRTSEGGKTLQRIMLFGPTLFPLAFAALGGRSLRNIARWKAERGSTIGELERLNGSQSFVTAVWLTFSLRSLNFVSVAVLLLWCLSPLGGQSSLRLLWPANSTVTDQQNIFYSNRDAQNYMVMANSGSFIQQGSVITLTSLETAKLFQNRSVDIWKHPKIPRIAQLELPNLGNSTSENPWINNGPEGDVSYSSLTGIGVFGLQADSVADFLVPYEYMHLDCTSHMRAGPNETLAFFESLKDLDRQPSGWPYDSPPMWYESAEETNYRRLFNQSFDDSCFFENTFFILSTNAPSKYFPKTIYYGTKDLNKTVSVYKCSLQSTMVEAKISCASDDCKVHQIRRSLEPRGEIGGIATRPWDIVHMDYAAMYFFGIFPIIGGVQSRLSINPIDDYIYGNSSKFSGFSSDKFRNWSLVPDVQVSQRLTQVFNTYWEAGRWFFTTSRYDPFARDLIKNTSDEPVTIHDLNQTEATVTRQIPIYKASVPWILILILCSGVLLLLGITSIFVTLQTSAPDILGYVSSLTRDNPHIRMPSGGSTLDGTERARLIRDLKVQIADLQEGKEVGYIALKSLETDATRTFRLRKDRVFS